MNTLERLGVDGSQIHLIRVQGAFELPLAAQRAAQLSALSQRQNYNAQTNLYGGSALRGQGLNEAAFHTAAMNDLVNAYPHREPARKIKPMKQKPLTFDTGPIPDYQVTSKKWWRFWE